MLSRAVDLDLLVQLYTSWLVLLPGVVRPLRWVRRAAGLEHLVPRVRVRVRVRVRFRIRVRVRVRVRVRLGLPHREVRVGDAEL